MDELFESKLKFITLILFDIGIDFHVLSEKNIDKCFFSITEIRPFEYTVFMFEFFGKNNESIPAEMKQHIELVETYNTIEYKVSFDQLESDHEKIALKIKMKEMLGKK